jgi:hypothetical protein
MLGETIEEIVLVHHAGIALLETTGNGKLRRYSLGFYD